MTPCSICHGPGYCNTSHCRVIVLLERACWNWRLPLMTKQFEFNWRIPVPEPLQTGDYFDCWDEVRLLAIFRVYVYGFTQVNISHWLFQVHYSLSTFSLLLYLSQAGSPVASVLQNCEKLILLICFLPYLTARSFWSFNFFFPSLSSPLPFPLPFLCYSFANFSPPIFSFYTWL